MDSRVFISALMGSRVYKHGGLRYRSGPLRQYIEDDDYVTVLL